MPAAHRDGCPCHPLSTPACRPQADPYAKLWLRDGAKAATSVKARTLNPQWDEHFTLVRAQRGDAGAKPRALRLRCAPGRRAAAPARLLAPGPPLPRVRCPRPAFQRPARRPPPPDVLMPDEEIGRAYVHLRELDLKPGAQPADFWLDLQQPYTDRRQKRDKRTQRRQPTSRGGRGGADAARLCTGRRRVTASPVLQAGQQQQRRQQRGKGQGQEEGEQLEPRQSKLMPAMSFKFSERLAALLPLGDAPGAAAARALPLRALHPAGVGGGGPGGGAPQPGSAAERRARQRPAPAAAQVGGMMEAAGDWWRAARLAACPCRSTLMVVWPPSLAQRRAHRKPGEGDGAVEQAGSRRVHPQHVSCRQGGRRWGTAGRGARQALCCEPHLSTPPPCLLSCRSKVEVSVGQVRKTTERGKLSLLHKNK